MLGIAAIIAGSSRDMSASYEEARCSNRTSEGTSKPVPQLTQRVTLAQFKTGEWFPMNNLIWLVGAVVIVLAILSFFGFR